MDINLEYYKFFYYVGKLKSITLAAEELAVSQPAVSQAIRHLEDLLGSALFVRTSKGVRFTPGKSFLILDDEKRRNPLDLFSFRL